MQYVLRYDIEPRGFGWAMPLYFLAAVPLTVAAAVLWRDASRRARSSKAALEKLEREQIEGLWRFEVVVAELVFGVEFQVEEVIVHRERHQAEPHLA